MKAHHGATLAESRRNFAGYTNKQIDTLQDGASRTDLSLRPRSQTWPKAS
jgi:hypothetical protein